jgi:xanthine dehydrogenase YagS FAD-binding subunit
MDFAIASVAAIITIEGRTCKDARIVLGAVAPAPIRAVKAENALKGKVIDAASAEAAATAAVAGAVPLTMNAYKIEVIKVLVQRAILS